MKEPGLDDRWRNEDGEIRRKRNDTHAGALNKDYPEFDQFRVDKRLGNIKRDLGLPPDASIKDVRKKLRWPVNQRLGLVLDDIPGFEYRATSVERNTPLCVHLLELADV